MTENAARSAIRSGVISARLRATSEEIPQTTATVRAAPTGQRGYQEASRLSGTHW